MRALLVFFALLACCGGPDWLTRDQLIELCPAAQYVGHNLVSCDPDGQNSPQFVEVDGMFIQVDPETACSLARIPL